MTISTYLLTFAISFLGCVLATPIATRVAFGLGAIDRPDNYRRIHRGATPRMGGLGLAFGIAAGLVGTGWGPAAELAGVDHQWKMLGWIAAAALVVLAVGVVDDARGIGPKAKLLGQGVAVVILFAGGVRIESVALLDLELPLSLPMTLGVPGFDRSIAIDPASFGVTLLWLLGCMNIWNLIDGMDGLASGVGLLVAGTLTLVAYSLSNFGSAAMATALAGSLAGFLLYNWHPACIFLGDSGSLLIGLLIGVVGIEGAQKGSIAVSLALPILAMGLPISDTALAIFRRWLRNLPVTEADRRHVHHLLIGLGLGPRQAAAMLYCFTSFLCGAVLLGVAAGNDVLALLLGLAGCAAFVLILYSRRDELATLRADLAARRSRGRQVRIAARLTWEAIQRVELAESPIAAMELAARTGIRLGCARVEVADHRPGREAIRHVEAATGDHISGHRGELSGATARFRIPGDGGRMLVVEAELGDGGPIVPDIAFRFLHRLALAAGERLARLSALDPGPLAESIDLPSPPRPQPQPERPTLVADH